MDAHGAGSKGPGRGCCDQRRGPQGAGGAYAEHPWAEGTSPSVASSGPGPPPGACTGKNGSYQEHLKPGHQCQEALERFS